MRSEQGGLQPYPVTPKWAVTEPLSMGWLLNSVQFRQFRAWYVPLSAQEVPLTFSLP